MPPASSLSKNSLISPVPIDASRFNPEEALALKEWEQAKTTTRVVTPDNKIDPWEMLELWKDLHSSTATPPVLSSAFSKLENYFLNETNIARDWGVFENLGTLGVFTSLQWTHSGVYLSDVFGVDTIFLGLDNPFGKMISLREEELILEERREEFPLLYENYYLLSRQGFQVREATLSDLKKDAILNPLLTELAHAPPQFVALLLESTLKIQKEDTEDSLEDARTFLVKVIQSYLSHPQAATRLAKLATGFSNTAFALMVNAVLKMHDKLSKTNDSERFLKELEKQDVLLAHEIQELGIHLEALPFDWEYLGSDREEMVRNSFKKNLMQLKVTDTHLARRNQPVNLKQAKWQFIFLNFLNRELAEERISPDRGKSVKSIFYKECFDEDDRRLFEHFEKAVPRGLMNGSSLFVQPSSPLLMPQAQAEFIEGNPAFKSGLNPGLQPNPSEMSVRQFVKDPNLFSGTEGSPADRYMFEWRPDRKWHLVYSVSRLDELPELRSLIEKTNLVLAAPNQSDEAQILLTRILQEITRLNMRGEINQGLYRDLIGGYEYLRNYILGEGKIPEGFITISPLPGDQEVNQFLESAKLFVPNQDSFYPDDLELQLWHFISQFKKPGHFGPIDLPQFTQDERFHHIWGGFAIDEIVHSLDRMTGKHSDKCVDDIRFRCDNIARLRVVILPQDHHLQARMEIERIVREKGKEKYRIFVSVHEGRFVLMGESIDGGKKRTQALNLPFFAIVLAENGALRGSLQINADGSSQLTAEDGDGLKVDCAPASGKDLANLLTRTSTQFVEDIPLDMTCHTTHLLYYEGYESYLVWKKEVGDDQLGRSGIYAMRDFLENVKAVYSK